VAVGAQPRQRADAAESVAVGFACDVDGLKPAIKVNSPAPESLYQPRQELLLAANFDPARDAVSHDNRIVGEISIVGAENVCLTAFRRLQHLRILGIAQQRTSAESADSEAP
jgi:hypothetical protein